MLFNLLSKGNAEVDVCKLSIVIVNYNNPDLLDACLKSIDAFLAEIPKEVVVVDNDSAKHDLLNLQEKYSFLRVIFLHENTGFGYANNVGVKNATGEILLLLNSDTEFIDKTFEKTLAAFESTQAPELWGPRLVWPGGKFQQSYSKELSLFDFLSTYTSANVLLKSLQRVRAHKYLEQEFAELTEVDVIYGTAILIRKSDYEKLGGFAKKYFMYFEDVDLCDRFRRVIGGHVKFDPTTTLIHRVKGSSSGKAFNLSFTKSQYLYGGSKFGYLIMLIILPIDIVFSWILRMVRKTRSI